MTSDRPRPVRLAAGASAVILVNKYRCDKGAKARATTVAVTPPGDTRALRLDLSGQRGMGWCGSGDPGSTVHVSPVASSLAGVTQQH